MPASDSTAVADGIPERSATQLQRRWIWLLVLGVVQLIAGTVALVLPVAASIAAGIIFGAVLLVSGVFQLVHAFSVRKWKGVALHTLSGLLYIAAGALALLFPLISALTLTIVVATLLIADGVVRTVLAYRLRPRAGWGWLLAGGIAGTAVGLMLLVGWPLTGLWAIGILLGVSLVISGITNGALALTFRLRNASDDAEHESLKHARPA